MTTIDERVSRLEGAYEHLATKEDVANVRVDVGNVRVEVESVRVDVGNVRVEVESVRTEIQRLENRLMRWSVATILATLGVGVAILVKLFA